MLGGLDNEWNGIQLLVEICDKDQTGTDDLIDLVSININASSVMVGVETKVTSYLGMFNYTTINLSYSIQCVENFNGPNCSKCVPGYAGSQCNVNINDCIGIDCGAHGECMDGIDSFGCKCNLGFSGDMCDEELPISESGPPVTVIIISVVVGGLVVLGALLIICIITAVFLTKRRKKRQSNIAESEIKMSKNVIYGIERNVTERDEHVDLTRNVSYADNRHQVKTDANVSYVPSQQAETRQDYEYIQCDYDYIT